jgi:hypothetical protein
VNETAPPSETFDPDSWEGDSDKLQPFQEEVLCSYELCELTFCSKQEAFATGLRLGSSDAGRDPNLDADLALTTASPTCISCGRTTDLHRTVSWWEKDDGDCVLVNPVEPGGYLCFECLEGIEAGMRPRPQSPGSG